MKPRESATVIGPKMKIRGEIFGTEDLLVDGEVDGIIRLEGACLTVRPEGHVRATVFAQDVVVMGKLEGEIRSSGLVNLRGSAIVQGDVFTARLSIEDGAQLRGNADPSKAGEPAPTTTPMPTKATAQELQAAAVSA